MLKKAPKENTQIPKNNPTNTLLTPYSSPVHIITFPLITAVAQSSFPS